MQSANSLFIRILKPATIGKPGAEFTCMLLLIRTMSYFVDVWRRVRGAVGAELYVITSVTFFFLLSLLNIFKPAFIFGEVGFVGQQW